MQKLQRNYYAEFIIEEDGQQKEVITVKYPITLNMKIDLDILGNASTGLLQFTNLERTIQAKLYIDRFTKQKQKNIVVNLYAGYQNCMPLIFSGNVIICNSYRYSGSVDWTTEVQAFAGGALEQYGFINATFTERTEIKDVLDYMLKDNPEIKLGCISPDLKPLTKNTTFIGQTLDILGRNFGDYDIFIDKGKLHVLGQRDVIKGELLVLTDSSGLLGVPRKSDVFVEAELLFEPQIQLGQAISLISKSQLIQDLGFNQAYEVVGIRHQGIISDRSSGILTTSVVLAALENEPRELTETKPTTYDSKNVSTQWDKPIKQGKGRISSPFGWREKPLPNSTENHAGIDIAADLNTPVYAPANGTITTSTIEAFNGNGIRMDHGVINGKHVTSVYAHLAARVVKPGQTVSKGELIGYVGSTGKDEKGKSTSSGPHLHFGIKENGQPVNPVKYIGNY
jgi:murein DD-endopeptidase MepM/ murein hydrolase activator NlpD